MTNILLAGANGNIGSFLYNHLKREYHIIPISKSHTSNSEIIPIDLTHEIAVETFTENFPKLNVLIFLIGLAHKKGKGKDLNTFRTVNVSTLRNLLSSLKDKNNIPDKIIFASTISVYGEKMDHSNYHESTECVPHSPYAITKKEAEEYLLSEFPDQSWILRIAPVYSIDFHLNVNRRTKAAGRFYKVGGGERKLSLCNLDNIEQAVQGILENKVPAGIYNISDKSEYSYNDLLKYENANWVIPVPLFLVKIFHYIGKLINSIFLKENTTKLITDNIYPSDKIRKYVALEASLNE